VPQKSTPYAGVEFGDRVVEFVDTFDVDITERCSFVTALLLTAGRTPDPIEIAASCKDMTLMDIAGGLPSRERAVALFGHYQIARDDFLRGSTEILPPDPMMLLAEMPIQLARSEWIGNPGCHQPLDDLMVVLTRAVKSFNIGVVASYLLVFDDQTLAALPICDGADIDRVTCELVAIVLQGYGEGRQIIDTEYPKALETLRESITNADMLAALLDPPEFLIQMMIRHRDVGEHEHQDRPAAPTIMTFPLPRGYKETPSGLVLPTNP